MGKELRNDLSWSVSRNNLFQTCQRAYYYHYYGAWNGWKTSAPEKTRQLYVLKNIKSLLMWVGTIVHDTIKDTLTGMKNHGTPFPPQAELEKVAVEKLRQGWRESVGKKYLEAPSRYANLFELYYGDGVSLPRETTDDVKARVLECIDNFAHLSILPDIVAAGCENWLTIDDKPETFPVNDLPVYAIIDFAYRDSEGFVHIIDWKTGKERSDELQLQLACYALFAMNKWQIPLEKIKLQGIFLRDGGRLQNYTCTPEALIAAQEQILTSSTSMRKLIKDADTNTVDEDNCPMRPANHCRDCNFKQVCPAIVGNNPL